MALHAEFYPSETVEPEFAKGNTIGVLKVRFQEIKGDFSGLPRRNSYGVGLKGGLQAGVGGVHLKIVVEVGL